MKSQLHGAVTKLMDLFADQPIADSCDLGTEEGQHFFKTNNLREKCKQYTEGATGMVVQLIDEKLLGRDASK